MLKKLSFVFIFSLFFTNNSFAVPSPKSLQKKPSYSPSFASKSAASMPASMRKNYEKKFVKKIVKETITIPKKPERVITKTPNVSKIIKTSSEYKKQKTLPIAKKAWQKPVVVIDPGHGGKDPGAISRNGTREKDIVFEYSKALKRSLEATGRYKVFMTRNTDKYVTLHGRVQAARRAGGHILLSIHADSHPNRKTQGFSVYTLSQNRAEREYNKLLAKSDKEEVIRGVKLKGESKDVKEALLILAQNETTQVSDEFAKTVAKNLGKTVKPLPRTHRKKSLAVLTAADMPAALLELGYLSNAYEEKLLKTKKHKEKLINSLKNAIEEYFKTHSYMI